MFFFWNPDISNVKESDYNRDFRSGAFSNWSIYEYEDVKEGDDFYMVICGSKNAVIARGVITSQPWEGDDWSPKYRRPIYYVELDTFVAVNPFLTDVLLTADNVAREIPDFNWYGGHAGRRLEDKNAATLAVLFEKYVKANPQLIASGAMWDDE